MLKRAINTIYIENKSFNETVHKKFLSENFVNSVESEEFAKIIKYNGNSMLDFADNIVHTN